MSVKSGKNTKIISRFKAGLAAKIESMGLKQVDVAQILNMNTGSLSKILSYGASAAIMEEVADKLGLDLLDLLMEGRAILEDKTVAINKPLPDPPLYGADLADIKRLLTEYIAIAKEGRAESKKRVEEFIGHIETLKKGVDDREGQLDDHQRKFYALLAEHKTDTTRMSDTIEFLKGQVRRYQDSEEEITESQKTDIYQG